ncbi:MAG: GlsB/YeaQ/YmgE family stress response membrane protein [Caulobacter sp.]|nr:GlsB/YeaQ/YmgE family stress response membrane protein [Caulobacter sp.]
MGTPGLFIVAVIGLLAGALGRLLLRGRPSRFASLIAGVVGALLGPPLAAVAGYPAEGPGGLALGALAGAVILLVPVALLTRR